MANASFRFDRNRPSIIPVSQNPLRVHYGNVFNVFNYGAAGDGVADDTAAIAATIADAAEVGGVVYFPCGVYLTDQITLTLNGTDGISFEGEGRSGQFGGTGSKIKLRSSSSALFSIQGHGYRFHNLTLDGNTLPTVAVVNFVPTASEIEFSHVHIQGAGLTGGSNPSALVNFSGTSEIDNVVFRRCRVAQDLANFTPRCPDAFKCYNSNAFNIAVEYSWVGSADVLFHFQQGAIDVRHTQVFEFTTAAWYIETYGQQHTIEDVYTETNPGTVSQSTNFYVQAFNAAGVTARPVRIVNCQIAAEADIVLIGTQPVYIENLVTAGNISIIPTADQAISGTIDVNSTTSVTGHSTAFLTEAPDGQEIRLRLNGELHGIDHTSSNTALTLSTPMSTTASGITGYRAYGFGIVSASNVRFVTVGKGFTGSGYPSQVDEDGSIYYGVQFVGRRLPSGVLRQNSSSWMNQTRNVTCKDGVLFDAGIAVFTGNRTWTFTNYAASDGMMITISRATAGDTNTLAVKNAGGTTLSTLSNVAGSVGMCIIYFDDTSGWRLLKEFVN